MTNAIRTVTVATKSGPKSIQSALTPVEAVQAILADPKASGFALDLATKSARWGLSPKQVDWAVFLAQEAIDRRHQASKPAAAPVAASAPIDVKALFSLFGTALLKLKYPRLRLQTADGRLVVIKVSGQGSRHSGSLNVTNGQKFGDLNSVFFGYVHQDGSVTIKDEGVLTLLKALASDPAKVAAEYGLASGSCCFCARSLSDSEAGSSEIGFGKTCAGNYGLPWQANGKAETVIPA